MLFSSIYLYSFLTCKSSAPKGINTLRKKGKITVSSLRAGEDLIKRPVPRFYPAGGRSEDMRIVVIDSHNEVLPYWFKEYLRLRRPLVEIRIDKHHDMDHECPALPATEGRQIFKYLAKIMPYLFEYARKEINEANFTCPAFHHGIIGALYHFDPRKEEIHAYGRVCGSEFKDVPRTKKKAVSIGGKVSNRIVWDEALTKLKVHKGKLIPVPQKITKDDLRNDLMKSRFPAIIGFDLDGIYEVGDSAPTAKAVGIRLEKAEQVLRCVPSPTLACIARSQAPRRYVPIDMVDCLQGAVSNLIKTIYKLR